ncbi:unnamed protein product [Phytophthora lilii]|uniref:Unnamed protein product n=1 Tax=Phytophthora lilii TaxID=2077276 RepID=A0A9W6WST1_9STRA|nr:unnamed protein product [Phytophthora lilii]
MGSIASNNDKWAHWFVGQYGYCASKAALNMITRSLAMDLREQGITVVAANPGYVETDMNNQQGVIKPIFDTVAAITDIVSKVKLDDTGKFYNADSAIPLLELPW